MYRQVNDGDPENTFFAEFHRIYEFKILFFELFLTNVNKIVMLDLRMGPILGMDFQRVIFQYKVTCNTY